MFANKAMEKLLQENNIDINAILPDDSYPIWQKCDRAERPYWGVSHFWHLDDVEVSGDCNLSQLEWDGNEIYFDTNEKTEIPTILKKAIGVMSAWKQAMKQNWPKTAFTMLATFDMRVAVINTDGNDPESSASITFRFWAPRDNEPIVNMDCFDDWDQPALADVHNCSFGIQVCTSQIIPTNTKMATFRSVVIENDN